MSSAKAAPGKRNKKQKKKGGVLRAILGTLLILFLFVALLVFVFIESKLSLIDYDPGTVPPEDHVPISAESAPEAVQQETITVDISGLERIEELALPTGEIREEKDVLNILLLGTDERTTEFNYASRSDAIMLVSIDFKNHTGKLVSFERGMGVLILDGEYEGQYDWLTHCFRYGGADLMLREIRELFLVDVDRYVRINFNSLVQIVDTVGGVDLNLSAAEADYLNSFRTDTSVEYDVVHEGMNHLNGAAALNFARCRHIDSDWSRIRRQRDLVQAFVNRVKKSDLKSLNDLMDTLLPLVKTNFTRGELLGLLPKVPGMLGLQFDQMTIPVDGSYGYMPIMNDNYGFAPDLDLNASILDEFLYGKS